LGKKKRGGALKGTFLGARGAPEGGGGGGKPTHVSLSGFGRIIFERGEFIVGGAPLV